VKWDDVSSSIYVGQEPVAPQIDIADLVTYFPNDYHKPDRGRVASFEIIGKKITPFNALREGGSSTYKLGSKYSQISGQFVVPETVPNSKRYGRLYLYSIDKDGKESLIKSFGISAGEEQLQINEDISEIDVLKIQTHDYGVFYNITLTAK